jgi:hypothetical protein
MPPQNVVHHAAAASGRVIVTTTINPPTEAIARFDELPDWHLIVIGDRKTPSGYRLRRGRYVTPEEQERRFPRLSALLGWNCIQRRNIGFLLALEMGADIVASVDDDNVPYPEWGQGLMIGRRQRLRSYRCGAAAFDPVGATNHGQLWHRGFPIQLVSTRDYSQHEERTETVRIQADFWDGDPDVDAVCRMLHRPACRFDPDRFPFTSPAFAPFNSQNTFLDAHLLPDYFMVPGVGRMDDIWGAYYLQATTGVRPVFARPSVEQRRNQHDLTRDFSAEVAGYENTHQLLEDIGRDPRTLFAYLPGAAVAAFLEYRDCARALLEHRA